MEAEVTLHQEYERGLPLADLHQLHLQGKVNFFTNCSLRVYLPTNTSLIVMLKKLRRKIISEIVSPSALAPIRSLWRRGQELVSEENSDKEVPEQLEEWPGNLIACEVS